MEKLPNIHPGEVLEKEFLKPPGIIRLSPGQRDQNSSANINPHVNQAL